jgi:putative sterol carrier protein
MSSVTAKDMIGKIKEKMNATEGLTEKVNTVFQFVLNGDGGGEWWFDLTGASPESGEGRHGNPACTITMNANDFVAMLNKDASAMKLFMSGKLKIDGDISAAMKLQNFF